MDDEIYVLADFSQLPGQKFYVSDKQGNVEEQFRTKKQNFLKSSSYGKPYVVMAKGVNFSSPQIQ